MYKKASKISVFLFAIITTIGVLSLSTVYSARNTTPIFSFKESGNKHLRIESGVPQYFGYVSDTGDIDNNGKLDLVVSSHGYSGSVGNSGAVYVFFNVEDNLDDLTTKDAILDMGTSAEYSLLITGEQIGDQLGGYDIQLGDLDNDNEDDLVIGNSKYDSTDIGAAWVVMSDSLLPYKDSFASEAIITDVYTLKFTEDPGGDLGYGLGGMEIEDIDGDNKNDLVVAAQSNDKNGRVSSGSMFLWYGSLIESMLSSGIKDFYVGDSANFSLRIDGPVASGQFSTQTTIGEFIGDGRMDIATGAKQTEYNGVESGSVYIFSGEFLQGMDVTPGNNIYDLADSDNFELRIDGEDTGEQFELGWGSVNHGSVITENDLVVAADRADHNGNGSGSVYILSKDLLDTMNPLSSGNTVNLDNIANYDIRIDGAGAGDEIAFLNLNLADIDNDGRDDVVFSGSTSYNGGNSRSVYTVFAKHIDNFIAAKTLNVNDTSPYNFGMRFDGETDDTRFGYSRFPLVDINNDGLNDFLITDISDGNGILQVFINFPHTINSNVDLEYTSAEDAYLVGDIDANNSVSEVDYIEYRLDSGNWMPCNPLDGAFDSQEEEYECDLSNLTNGVYNYEVRARDNLSVVSSEQLYSQGVLYIDNDLTLVETGETRFLQVALFFGAISIVTFTHRVVGKPTKKHT